MLYISSFVLFISTLVPGLLLLRYTRALSKDATRRFYSGLNDVTAGILMGIGFFHLLPELYEHGGDDGYSILYSTSAIIVFVFDP